MEWIFKGNTLLREIEPEERKNALGQLAPRLASVLDTDLEWAVNFIADIDTEKGWEWFNLDRRTFYGRHCSIAAERIDEIKKEVAKLRAIGRPIPKSAKDLGEKARDDKAEADNRWGAGRGNKMGDNITHFRNDHGTSRSYLLRALARHAPEILERFEQGEFKSVRAAAIAGGIIKLKTPLDNLRTAWKKASEQERQTFLEEVS
jgi:hypothetical protein